jgi:hypothetical protein
MRESKEIVTFATLRVRYMARRASTSLPTGASVLMSLARILE